MSTWIEDLGQEVEQRRQGIVLSGLLLERAVTAAPVLFTRLVDQIESDVTAYRLKVGDASIGVESTGDRITVTRGKFPTFDLKLTLRNSTIVVQAQSRKSSSARVEKFDGLIQILAGSGPDEYYFHSKGIEHADPSAVSEQLLAPLFRLAIS